jgi:hypothetical protein
MDKSRPKEGQKRSLKGRKMMANIEDKGGQRNAKNGMKGRLE